MSNKPARFYSPLTPWHIQNKASFVDTQHGQIVDSYVSDGSLNVSSNALASGLNLFDATGLARLGFKGADSAQWLQSQGYDLPAMPNQACIQNSGERLLRLSHTEFWLLESLSLNSRASFSDFTNLAEQAQQSEHRVYPILRNHSHGCFVICGAASTQMFSKLCAIDLRHTHFPNMSIAQTSIARVNGILLRDDLAHKPAFIVFTDISLLDYLWPCLLDAMAEFDGSAIGLKELIALTSSTDQ